jgi:DNA repair ATPase RecN
MVLLIAAVTLLGAVGIGGAPADHSTNYVLTPDVLNKTLGALGDLRTKNLPIKIGDDSLDAEIANLQKQPKVESLIKKRGLSLREFVLTYKAAAQIREAEKARDNWQRILQDPSAAPQAKLDATQKLADSLKNTLFTPEQIELVRRRMPELETLLPTPK